MYDPVSNVSLLPRFQGLFYFQPAGWQSPQSDTSSTWKSVWDPWTHDSSVVYKCESAATSFRPNRKPVNCMDFFGRLPWELQPGDSLVKRSPLPLMVDKLTICALLRERVLEHWSTAVWKVEYQKEVLLWVWAAAQFCGNLLLLDSKNGLRMAFMLEVERWPLANGYGWSWWGGAAVVVMPAINTQSTRCWWSAANSSWNTGGGSLNTCFFPSSWLPVGPCRYIPWWFVVFFPWAFQ